MKAALGTRVTGTRLPLTTWRAGQRRPRPDARCVTVARATTAVSNAEPRRSELAKFFSDGAATAPTAAEARVNVAALDSRRFREHWSVDFWRDFTAPAPLRDDDQPLTSRMRDILGLIFQAITDGEVFSSRTAAAYWAYHLSRSTFFITQGFAALLAARTTLQGNPTKSLERWGGTNSEQGIKLERLVRSGFSGPVIEALGAYYQDWQNIKEGTYKLPWDMTTPTNRQFNPLFVFQKARQFFGEASATLKRRSGGKPEDVWLCSGLYPNYYLNTFHFQTDGWLSQHSAQVYEVSTETLFVGRQDAMQRQSLVPLSAFVRERGAPKGDGLRLLEVAAGTGRFATFIKDNFPWLHLTALDLSPFFLAEARANMQRWREQRTPGELLGGPDGTGSAFLQAAAESIPGPDASYDAVVSVYLFHELPPEVRRAAAKEMARVLKPGGLLVLTDSVQMGDRTSFDKTLGAFQDFNEPYYRSYIATDLGELFEAAGLEPDQKLVCSSSKTLSFRKPLSAAGREDGSQPASQVDDVPPRGQQRGGKPAPDDDTAGADKDLADMPAVPAS